MKWNFFNFKEFEGKYLLTNDFGDYVFVGKEDFKKIIQKDINLESDLGKILLENNIIYNDTELGYSLSKRNDMRRVKSHVCVATSLHIFVVTTACNMKCVYCQANNGVTAPSLYMTKEIAKKSADIALMSPAKYLSFEFQGGEPLLNFSVIRYIVEYAEANKKFHEIRYNVVSNLTLLTDEMSDFFEKYDIGISTSVDGPEFIHNANRSFRDGSGTWKKVMDSVTKIRGKGLRVGAIQTTTRNSLPYPKEIVHAYYELGFDSIFLRPLTPLGKAAIYWDKIGYSPEEFLRFYTLALDELMRINLSGTFLKEDHATILFSKISKKYINYMELRSPCGASTGQMAYYADGNVFTCDEGRMLYEMGDASFKLGNVSENTYADIIGSGVCKAVCESGILETIPTCCDCVYQPYCGTCPVVNYARGKDIIEKNPRGYRCKIYGGMLDYLFKQISDGNINVINILNSWSN